MSAPRQVHQLLAALSYGDAIGNEALAIQRHLRAAGYDSHIYAERVHPRMARLARPLWRYPEVSGPDTVCVYHFSIGSAAGRLIYHAPDRLVSIYHNITPAHFFLGFHEHLAGLCYHGRRELRHFAERTELALGDSEYNRRELEDSGYRQTGVLPIVLEMEKYARAPGRVFSRMLADARRTWLFVGRVIPNKKIESLLRAFAWYQRHCEPRSRLIVAGDVRGYERYYTRLRELEAELRLQGVLFTGQLDDADLMACYAAADVFVCLSEHEGFCVPLLEAMLFEKPVIAFDAGAVSETLAGGGVLLKGKEPALVAELVQRVLEDGALKRRVLDTQARSIERLRRTDFGALLQERLAPVLAGDAS